MNGHFAFIFCFELQIVFVKAKAKSIFSLNSKISLFFASIHAFISTQDLLNKIRGLIGCLYKLSEAVWLFNRFLFVRKGFNTGFDEIFCSSNELESDLCFLSRILEHSWLKLGPFLNSHSLAIRKGRHPIMVQMHQCGMGPDVTPNDIYICESSNMLLVMGANMVMIAFQVSWSSTTGRKVQVHISGGSASNLGAGFSRSSVSSAELDRLEALFLPSTPASV
jgi:hypothetical protein